jgi:hypothetical protein
MRPTSLRASSPFTLKAEAPVSSETSGTARPTTQLHVQDILCLPDVSNGSAVDRDRVAGFCEHDNEPWGYVKGWEFCESLSYC